LFTKKTIEIIYLKINYQVEEWQWGWPYLHDKQSWEA
jgi:hypothetical protein